jgi:MFS family permease
MAIPSENLNQRSGHSFRATAAVIISVAVVGFATGFTIPLVSLRMAQQGYNELLIGLMAAVPALGFIVSAPIVRHLLALFGKKRMMLACFALSAISILLLEFISNISLWFPLRLVMGASAGIIIAIGEAWINESAGEEYRGRIVAAYTTIFTVCQLCGPLVIALMGVNSVKPIIISTALHGLAAITFFMMSRQESAAQREQTLQGAGAGLSIWRFIRQAPAICVGVLFFSFFDGTVLSLFPVYGMHHGYSEALAAFMVSVLLGGDAFLQMPIGWLADHMNRAKLHRLCGFLTLGLSLLLPLAMQNTWLLYPLLAILGATAGGIYTLALIQIGQRHNGDDLVTANAAAGILWGLGSLIGPILGGAASAVGPNGLPITLALAAVIFIVATFARSQQMDDADNKSRLS